MKAKTIDKEIHLKMNEWINTLPTDLRGEVRDSIVVTGGCIASMFLQETVNDFDVYFTDAYVLERVCSYYCGKAADLNPTKGKRLRPEVSSEVVDGQERFRIEIIDGSRGIIQESNPKSSFGDSATYVPVFISGNAISLSDKVQLVTRFIGSVDVIHSTYDFTHATNYWTYKSGLVTNTEALECILARELKYRGSRYPLASIFRTRKFIQRGWSCHIGNYLKMAFQLQAYDLTDINALRDQLTGVDALYLFSLIHAAEEADKELSIDNLCEMCDAIIKDENFKENGHDADDSET